MTESPKKILVILVMRYGDTLFITPILKALKSKWPNCHLTVLVHKRSLSILENLTYINQLAAISRKSARWHGWLSKKHYDIALVYRHTGENELISYAKRISHKTIAFAAKNTETPNITFIATPTTPMSGPHKNAMLVKSLGINIQDWCLDYRVSTAEAIFAEKWLLQHGLVEKRLVGLQLQGFSTKAYRDWPLENFYLLSQQILSAFPNIHFILLGDIVGQPAAKALADQLPEKNRTVLAGTVTMRENAAIMARLSLYIGTDTGPTHVAGALGIPMVALYHCMHPGRYMAPQQHPALKVIEHPVAFAEASPHESMARISVETVWSAVQELFK